MAAATNPTPTQEFALAEAVVKAYRNGWKGSLREKKRPRVYMTAPSWSRQRPAVTEPTLNSMMAKGLVEQLVPRGPYLLTKRGVELGEDAYAKAHGVTARETAEAKAKEEADAKAKREAEVEQVKHMFRGLKTKRGPIEKEISSSGISNNLRLEDLMELGKGIDKLRGRS